MKVGWGKYADCEWHDVPDDYLEWLIQSSQNNIRIAQQELDRREAIRDAGTDPMEREIKVWFRERVKQTHPDKGGTHEGMLLVNQLHDQFLDMMRIYRMHKGNGR